MSTFCTVVSVAVFSESRLSVVLVVITVIVIRRKTVIIAMIYVKIIYCFIAIIFNSSISYFEFLTVCIASLDE